MPTRKPPRLRPIKAPKVSVRLTDAERKRIGVPLLAPPDGKQRTTVLADLERTLGHWASALANVPHILLRSDLVSWTEPLAEKGETFLRSVDRLDNDIRTFVAMGGFVDFAALRRQIEGFRAFVTWVEQEPPKRGGERRAAVAQVHASWRPVLGAWFDRHTKAELDSREGVRPQFLRTVQGAVERAVKTA